MRVYIIGGCIFYEVIYSRKIYILGGCIFWEGIYSRRYIF